MYLPPLNIEASYLKHCDILVAVLCKFESCKETRYSTWNNHCNFVTSSLFCFTSNNDNWVLYGLHWITKCSSAPELLKGNSKRAHITLTLTLLSVITAGTLDSNCTVSSAWPWLLTEHSTRTETHACSHYLSTLDCHKAEAGTDLNWHWLMGWLMTDRW